MKNNKRYEKSCEACGSVYQTDSPIKMYCCQRCRYKAERKKEEEDSLLPVYEYSSTMAVGAVHELLVSVDLMRRGFYVFRALSPAGPCDLVAIAKDEMYRIEVTTGVRTLAGTLSFRKKSDRYLYDFLAVVFHHGDILWYDENGEGCFGPIVDSETL